MKGNIALVYDMEEEKKLCEWCGMRKVEEKKILVLGIGRLDLCSKCSLFFVPPWSDKG